MVCWVSKEKRKHEVKSWMAEAQGTKVSFAWFTGSKSPCTRKVRYHTIAKPSHEKKKAAAKITYIQPQLRSMMDTKISCEQIKKSVT